MFDCLLQLSFESWKIRTLVRLHVSTHVFHTSCVSCRTIQILLKMHRKRQKLCRYHVSTCSSLFSEV
jgi:hypothetical protein